MFKWTQREESKRWILESERFPNFASFGTWNNPDEHKGDWAIRGFDDTIFWNGDIPEHDIKNEIEKLAILEFAEAIRSIVSNL